METATDKPHKRSAADTPPANPLTLHLDMEKYLGQIEDWDSSEKQKREFIATLWKLLRSFAEIGFEIAPVQQAQNACGKLTGKPAKPSLKAPGALQLEGNKPTTIKRDFGASTATGTERIQR